ncbi:MAG TPA: glycosyltransferase family 2 protein [Bryobacteraceae bacterium]|nr:glycosyltransferase family 2 protein [Bryobacteraceae bacterium]
MAWSLFLAGAGFAFYIVAGYPLLLAVLARWRPRPIRKQFSARSVTVLLAVYNGEAWIRAKLESILQLDYPREHMRILVVSDGSTDETDAIAGQFQSQGVELLRVPHAGKAAALNAGIARAKGEILFFTDVRQRLEPDALRQLVACLGDPRVGGVSGQIQLMKGTGGREADVGLYWRFEKWLRDQLTAVGSVPVATGCIYALRRELARPLPAAALIDDAYLPLAAIFQGYRFVFERRAIAYDYPTQLEIEFQRKVRTLAGLFQVVGSYPRLLNVFTPVGFHFFSYKLGRLLLPYALLLVAVSSFWLPRGWADAAVGGQILLYGLAAVDHWIPGGLALKRLSSVCRTFVMLLAAAFWAASVLFLPAGKLWKQTHVDSGAKSKAALEGD